METNANQNRGMASEAMVEQALLYWRNKPRPDVIPSIESFIHAAPNSKLDKKQIDFLVKCEGDVSVPIQVKSTKRARVKFERRCQSLGRLIVAIAVEVGDTIGKVMWKIAKGIIRFIAELNSGKGRLRIPEEKKPILRKKRFCYRYNPVCMCH